ncbi:sugar transporter [Meredithblackwellia eburnea MCA 4105]
MSPLQREHSSLESKEVDSASATEAGKPTTMHLDHIHDANRGIIDQAMIAEVQERMTVTQAIKAYPQASVWCCIVSFLILMEGYDLALVSNLMAQPAFSKHYGIPIPGEPNKYAVPAAWQSALNQASTIGAFFGILLCGYIQPKIGYRKSILIALVAMVAVIFITFFAPDVKVLFIGQLLSGLPFGWYNALAQSYASELAPLPLFITFGILYTFRNGSDKWSYKIPFAIQWAWPPLLFGALWFAPESPWWLTRVGRLDDAEAVVKRLEGNGGRRPADVVAYMQRTIEIENKEVEGASYAALFQGIDLRRTLIACITFSGQTLSGLFMSNQAVYFFSVAGVDTNTSFGLGLGVNAIQWCCVLLTFFMSTLYGRRTLYLGGVAFQCLMLLAIGIAAAVSSKAASFWVQATFLMLIAGCYGFTVGPLTFTIVAEASSVKLRTQTCALARASNYAMTVAFGYISAYSLNPTAWNLQGRASFIWLGTGVLMFIFAFFFVPETKDRSFRELDVLYHRKVPARHFKKTVVGELDDE